MTAAEFRAIALALVGATESAHMGHPDFRANGRIFASLRSDVRGTIKLPPQDQASFVADHPSVFTPEAGAWGLQGYTRVDLGKASAEILGEAMTRAWQHVMAGPPVAPRAKRPASPRAGRPATPRAKRR